MEAGVPPTARPFGALGYRQAVEHLRGGEDEAATRELDRPRDAPIRPASVDLVSQRA